MNIFPSFLPSFATFRIDAEFPPRNDYNDSIRVNASDNEKKTLNRALINNLRFFLFFFFFLRRCSIIQK